MNKIIGIYDSILRYSGMESDDKGYVSVRLGDKKEPSTVEGKRLVLPMDAQLRSFNGDEKMIFHPLSENILRGESLILNKLKHCINIKLNYSIGVIGQTLLNIVASPALHAGLSSDQSDVLISIREADEKSVINFASLMVSGVKTKADKLYTNIYLKRGGTIGTQRFSRVGVVSFPFYDDLVNDRIEKIRVKDKETYRQLFEYIFPDISKPESYNYGTNTQVAPYLDALMMSSLNVASKINDLALMFADHIDNHEAIMFDGDWIEFFRDLDALSLDIRRIPVQYGNDGSISITEQQEEQKPVAPQQQTQYQPQQPQMQQQYQPQYQQPPQMMAPQMPVPQQQQQRGKVTMRDALNAIGGNNQFMTPAAMNPFIAQGMQQQIQYPPHGSTIMTPYGPAMVGHAQNGVFVQFQNGNMMPYIQLMQQMQQQQQPMNVGYSASMTGFGNR